MPDGPSSPVEAQVPPAPAAETGVPAVVKARVTAEAPAAIEASTTTPNAEAQLALTAAESNKRAAVDIAQNENIQGPHAALENLANDVGAQAAAEGQATAAQADANGVGPLAENVPGDIDAGAMQIEKDAVEAAVKADAAQGTLVEEAPPTDGPNPQAAEKEESGDEQSAPEPPPSEAPLEQRQQEQKATQQKYDKALNDLDAAKATGDPIKIQAAKEKARDALKDKWKTDPDAEMNDEKLNEQLTKDTTTNTAAEPYVPGSQQAPVDAEVIEEYTPPQAEKQPDPAGTVDAVLVDDKNAPPPDEAVKAAWDEARNKATENGTKPQMALDSKPAEGTAPTEPIQPFEQGETRTLTPEESAALKQDYIDGKIIDEEGTVLPPPPELTQSSETRTEMPNLTSEQAVKMAEVGAKVAKYNLAPEQQTAIFDALAQNPDAIDMISKMIEQANNPEALAAGLSAEQTRILDEMAQEPEATSQNPDQQSETQQKAKAIIEKQKWSKKKIFLMTLAAIIAALLALGVTLGAVGVTAGGAGGRRG